jgi:hypothetical protein
VEAHPTSFTYPRSSLVKKALSRTLLIAVVAAPVFALSGCSGADDPKLAAPTATPPAPDTAKDTAPPKTPGGAAYGANKKYQDSMPK